MAKAFGGMMGGCENVELVSKFEAIDDDVDGGLVAILIQHLLAAAANA